VANFWEDVARWAQKPQSVLSGATLGTLRSLGLSDPNSQFMPGASNFLSGALEGNKHQILPQDFYREATGHDKPNFIEKALIELPLNVGYDPFILAGPAGKAVGLGGEAVGLGAKGAQAASALSKSGKAAEAIAKGAEAAKTGEEALTAGQKTGRALQTVTNLARGKDLGTAAPDFMRGMDASARAARGAQRLAGLTYQGNLATHGQNLQAALPAGLGMELGGNLAGRVLGPAAEYLGPKLAPEGSALAKYMEGRALGQKLGMDMPGRERYTNWMEGLPNQGATEGNLGRLGEDVKSAYFGETATDPVKAAAARRLAEATTPREAAGAAIQGGANELAKAAPPTNASPFSVPASVRTGPGTYGEMPSGMTINPQPARGLQQTVPWAPSTEPDPFGEALFGRQAQEGAQLFDPRQLAPGRMAPGPGGPGTQMEFPRTLGQGSQFNEPTYGPQTEFGPTPPGQPPQGMQPPGPPPQAIGRAAQNRVLPNKRYIPGTPGPVGTPGPEISGPSALDFRPSNAGAPWEGAMPQTMGPSALGPNAVNPEIPPWLKSATQSPGFNMTGNLPEAASGNQIIMAIQEALQRGIPMNEVYRAILGHQFPGRI
jgi:hypothetical protein